VYIVDGILLACIYIGLTDAVWFEDFVEQLLYYCGKWLEPRSVFVIDNAFWYNKERLERLCADVGVKLLFLPPYSLDFNPIEEL
jgi:transposase